MDSSSVAFERFSKWKNARTVLKVTEVENGMTPGNSIGLIIGSDEANGLVMFSAESAERIFRTFNLTGASFEVEALSLTATKGLDDRLIFEETIVF